MKNTNRNSFNLLSFLSGAVVTAIIYTIIMAIVFSNVLSGKGSNTNSDKKEKVADSTESVDNTELKNNDFVKYNTDVKDWDITLDSGEKVKYNTPEGFYSLSDQYLDNLKTYYKVDKLKSDSLVVVGDKNTPYDSDTIINADKLSDVNDMLSQLYGDDYKEEEVQQSEAYTYMKTGKIPDDAPDNYKIDEVETVKVDGIEYVIYEVNYDTTYENTSDSTKSTESTEAATSTVHTQQLACYSKTDDAMEIIVYQTKFNKDSALKYLKEFLGAK